MSAPAPAYAGLPTTGWSSPDLGRAYFAVEGVLEGQSLPVAPQVSTAIAAALKAIEVADGVIEAARA